MEAELEVTAMQNVCKMYRACLATVELTNIYSKVFWKFKKSKVVLTHLNDNFNMIPLEFK